MEKGRGMISEFTVPCMNVEKFCFRWIWLHTLVISALRRLK